MNTTDRFCDYCFRDQDEGAVYYLRPTGFTTIDGHRAPTVKTWCGNCTPGDQVDPAAYDALRAAITAQTGGAA